MKWQQLLELAFSVFHRDAGAERLIGSDSYYIDVPVELTIGKLRSHQKGSDFHELHETPFQLFSCEAKNTARTTLLGPSISILVGQYGMGKTSFVRQLCSRLRSNGQFPLVINLADCRQVYGSSSYMVDLNEDKMAKFLFSHLFAEQVQEQDGLEDTLKELLPEIYSGRVVFVLDSLDELGLTRADLRRFMQVLAGFLMPKKVSDPFDSRAVLTVRSEYLAAFAIDDADTLLGEDVAQVLTVYFLKLSAFTESRIQSYLERRKKPEVAKQLTELPSLREILVRPLFLRIFCDLADRMMARDLRQMKSPTLLINSFIERASDDARSQVRKAFRWNEAGLSEMALRHYNTGKLDIDIEDVRADLIRSSNLSIEETWLAIHKCPFLRKSTETKVRFSHRVFIEYFTARELALEGAREDGSHYNAFDTLVLDVDTRKFLKDLYGDEWYERTRRSYGFEDTSGWDLPGGLDVFEADLERIRRSLLDYMTDPERTNADSMRPFFHEFLTLDKLGLHPCYRMYNYESLAVFLWHNQHDEEDQRLSSHFEKVLVQRLDESNRKLDESTPLRPHYERLVERILSIRERLRYETLSRFDTTKLLEKIGESDTRNRIEQIVTSVAVE